MGTKNARPGEPEGLPDLTSRTLTQPARGCQAGAEAVAVDADGVDVDRAAALAALDDQRVERDVRVGLVLEGRMRQSSTITSGLFASRETWLFESCTSPSGAR